MDPLGQTSLKTVVKLRLYEFIVFHATLGTEWDILQVAKALGSVWLPHETTPMFPEAFIGSLFLCFILLPTAASSSYNIIPQAQARTAPGNQREPLKMKQLQINKDSMT